MTRPKANQRAEQFVFDLPARTSLDRDSFFIAGPNAAAVAAIDAHHNGVLALEGPEGAGKSHLAALWAERHAARQIDAKACQTDDVPALLAHPLVVEDLNDLPDAAETALFHLLNLAKAEGGLVLLTGTAPLRGWARLPDLSSRLQVLPRATLNPPDDALLAAVLTKQLRDRQTAFTEPAIAYALTHMERSFSAARRLAVALDHRALAAKRRVTRAIVQDVMAADT